MHTYYDKKTDALLDAQPPATKVDDIQTLLGKVHPISYNTEWVIIDDLDLSTMTEAKKAALKVLLRKL